MPVQTCLSNIFSTRFDFGVPLEDVFPPDDIHPRLKYLFGKAFESYIGNGSNIEHILRYAQGTLSERLKLKDKLVLALDYHLNTEDFSPGAFFWVIRHFLGLLPLPLLPSYTKGVQFNWDILADRCKSLFRCHDNHQRNILDNDVAESLNMLPIENVFLLNVIIKFIRKISYNKFRRQHKFDRTSLLALTNYYCSSLFARPFRPGYFQQNEYRPFLLYLILRWQNISQHCQIIGHPTCFLESDLNIRKYRTKDDCTQTNLCRNAFFNPEVIPICKNIPCLVNFCNKYLKDIACQTETDLCKKIGPELQPDTKCNVDVYKLAYIQELEEGVESTKTDEVIDTTLYQTAPEFAFNDILEKDDWSTIVKDTMETVKKVEGSYIYDDYETFNKEDFNQIGKSKTGSFLSRIGKYSHVSSSSKNSPKKETIKSSTPKKNSPESENSYVKYPDVFSSEDSENNVEDLEYNEDKNRDSEEIKVTDHNIKRTIPIAQRLFQSNSPASLQGEDSKQGLQDENVKKNKRQRCLIKKLRLSLDFLRTMTPKKNSFKIIESKIKYHRITNGKFHTI